jgi:hypothetical protein
MFQARNQRMLETDRATRQAAQPDSPLPSYQEPSRRVSDIELFDAMGIN